MMTWHTQGGCFCIPTAVQNKRAGIRIPLGRANVQFQKLARAPFHWHAHCQWSQSCSYSYFWPYLSFNLCSWSHQRFGGNSSAHWARICWGENFELFWLLLPTPRKTFDPPTFLLIVTLIDSRHPKVSIMLCDLTFNISVSRPFPTILPRCLAKSQKTCISLKLLPHLRQPYEECVRVKEQAKSFHTILPLKFTFPRDGQEGGMGCSVRRVRPQKWAKITPARFFSLEVTDTFSLTPCARSRLLWIVAGAQISSKSDLSSKEIWFFLEQNLVSNLTNPFLNFWTGRQCLGSGGVRLTASLGFPDRRLRGRTRTQEVTGGRPACPQYAD